MKSLTLTIPGIPQAQRRPRFARRGKFVVTYSDQATEAGKFLLEARRQAQGVFLDGPLELKATFVMPRPKGHYGTGKNSGLLKASAPEYHTKKPDLDNLIKFIKDCLNSEIYHDDSAIVWIRASKIYVTENWYLDKPCTLISLTQLEEQQ